MNTDLRTVWIDIRNNFYSVFFALMISATLVWEKGLFNWIKNSDYYGIIAACIMLLLYIYFIIDWQDANLITKIDKEITLQNIILWLMSVVTLTVSTVFIINEEKSIHVIWSIIISSIYGILTISMRDREADIEWIKKQKDEFKEIIKNGKTGKELDEALELHAKAQRVIKHGCRNTIIFNIIVLGSALYHLLIGFGLEEELIMPSSFAVLIILWIFNLILKLRRHKYILVPLHNRNLAHK